MNDSFNSLYTYMISSQWVGKNIYKIISSGDYVGDFASV